MHPKKAHPAHANGESVPIRWIAHKAKKKDSPSRVTVSGFLSKVEHRSSFALKHLATSTSFIYNHPSPPHSIS